MAPQYSSARTTFGWSIRLAARNSCSNRRKSTGWRAVSAGITFRATIWCVTLCRALNTAPIPPSAIFTSSS